MQDIAHVINYDLPDITEDLIHRVGRTGPAGERGVASTLFVGDQWTELFELERTLGIRMERGFHEQRIKREGLARSST